MPAKKKKPANLPSPETIVKMQRAVIAAEPLGTAKKKVNPRLEKSGLLVGPDGPIKPPRLAQQNSVMISVPEAAPYGEGPAVRVPVSIPTPPAYPLNARPDGIDERGRPVVQQTYQGPLTEDMHNRYYSELDAWGQQYLPLLRKSMRGRSL